MVHTLQTIRKSTNKGLNGSLNFNILTSSSSWKLKLPLKLTFKFF